MMWMVLPFIALGAALGSFANMYAFRFGPDRPYGFDGHRSLCDFCQQKLAWYDNIPIISYLFLKGRSRCCRRPLPVRYLIVEVLAVGLGGLAAMVGLRYLISAGWLWQIGGWGLIIISLALSLMIIAYDLAYYLIPIKPVVGLGLAGLIWLGWFTPPSDWGINLLAALASSGFIALLYLVTRGKGMGLGDAILVLALGVFLGWPGAVAAVWLSFVAGALLGSGLVLCRQTKRGFKSLIPLGPFLITAFWLSWAFNWWQILVQWS